MVIKYQTCSFSEYKIAPGHGMRYAEANGKKNRGKDYVSSDESC